MITFDATETNTDREGYPLRFEPRVCPMCHNTITDPEMWTERQVCLVCWFHLDHPVEVRE